MMKSSRCYGRRLALTLKVQFDAVTLARRRKEARGGVGRAAAAYPTTSEITILS